jgi:hypothetical protein
MFHRELSQAPLARRRTLITLSLARRSGAVDANPAPIARELPSTSAAASARLRAPRTI